MASVRNLKKEINYVYGDILDIVYLWEIANGGKPSAESDAIVNDIYSSFDDLIKKVNDKSVENKKAHIKATKESFESEAQGFVDRVNALK